MKKIFSIILALSMVLSVALFAACTKEKDPDVDADAVEITVAIKADSTEKQYFNAFKKAFNKVNTKISLKMITFADYAGAMKNYIATDSMPDIVWCTGDYHHAYSSTGHYEDLTPYFEKDNISVDNYYSSSINSARLTSDTTDAKYNSIWFMPRDYNRLTIMYNKKMFDAAKIAYPSDNWTWDEFVSICRVFKEKMQNAENPAAGLNKYSTPANLLINDNVGGFTAITTLGGKLINADGSTAVATTETQNAYTALRALVKDGLFVDPSKSSSVDFARNTIAMTACVRPVVPGYINEELDFDFAPYPLSATTQVGAGCSGYAMSATSEHKEEAWEFLKFIGSEAGQRAFASTAGCVPVLKSVAEDDTAAWKNFTNAYGKTLNHNAFIANSDKDLYLNIFDKRDPRISESLLKDMQDLMYACMHDTFNKRGSIISATEYYADVITKASY